MGGPYNDRNSMIGKAALTELYVYDGSRVTALAAPAARPLRFAAWAPDGARALLVGNRGQALWFDGTSFEPLETGVKHNLRGLGWSPDGQRALIAGNRGAVLLLERGQVRELPSPTVENLRRVAWSPDGSCALIAGNAGVVLRFDGNWSIFSFKSLSGPGTLKGSTRKSRGSNKLLRIKSSASPPGRGGSGSHPSGLLISSARMG